MIVGKEEMNLGNSVGELSNRKLFISGLSCETQEDTLKDFFGQFGDILEAVITRDKATGKSRGCGYVIFREAKAAAMAVRNAHWLEIDDRAAGWSIQRCKRYDNRRGLRNNSKYLGSFSQWGGYGANSSSQPRTYDYRRGLHNNSNYWGGYGGYLPPYWGGYGANLSSQCGTYGILPKSHEALITHRLNGKNYFQWSQNVLMFVRGMNKEKYLTGTPAPPPVGSVEFKTWFTENNMVMTWLVNSMTVEISEKFLLATTAKEIWDSARKTYSIKENNATTIFKVKQSLRNLFQRDKNVTQYYDALMKLWEQIDIYDIHQWSCRKDELCYKKIVDQERCYEFLSGLHDSFENVRDRILNMKPLPPLEEAFNMVRREENIHLQTQKLYAQFSIPHFDMPPLAIHRTQGNIRGGKSRMWCDNCNKNGHHRDTCWKLLNKPSNSKQSSKNEGKGLYVDSKESENGSLNNEELLILRKILEKHSAPNSVSALCEKNTPSVTLAQAGLGLSKDD